MGYERQPDGSLEFTDDASDPVTDFQESHEYAKQFAMYRDGTRYERENLPVAQHPQWDALVRDGHLV